MQELIETGNYLDETDYRIPDSNRLRRERQAYEETEREELIYEYII